MWSIVGYVSTQCHSGEVCRSSFERARAMRREKKGRCSVVLARETLGASRIARPKTRSSGKHRAHDRGSDLRVQRNGRNVRVDQDRRPWHRGGRRRNGHGAGQPQLLLVPLVVHGPHPHQLHLLGELLGGQGVGLLLLRLVGQRPRQLLSQAKIGRRRPIDAASRSRRDGARPAPRPALRHSLYVVVLPLFEPRPRPFSCHLFLLG